MAKCQGGSINLVTGWLLSYLDEIQSVGWGIAVATFLFAFQASVFVSFWRTGALMVGKLDADIWVYPKGVQDFESPGLLDSRYEWLLYGASYVSEVEKVVAGFAPLKNSAGYWTDILLVGYTRLPDRPLAVFVEATDQARLDADVGDPVEIGGRRAYLGGLISGYSSFMGMPYVLTDYPTGKELLGINEGKTHFLLLKATGSVNRALHELRSRFPELAFSSKAEMSSVSSAFWVKKTGAGGAILSAALLALAVGFVFSYFSVQRFVDHLRDDMITLLLLGGEHGQIARAVVGYCSGIAIVAAAVGALAVVPCSSIVRLIIPWVFPPAWIILGSVLIGGALAALAAHVAVGALDRLDEMEALRG